MGVDPSILMREELAQEDDYRMEIARLEHKLPGVWREQHERLARDPAIAQWGRDVVVASITEIETIIRDQYPLIDPAVIRESSWGRLLTSSPEDLLPLFRVVYDDSYPGYEVYRLAVDVCSKTSKAIVPDVGQLIAACNPEDHYPYNLRANPLGPALGPKTVRKIAAMGQKMKRLEPSHSSDTYHDTLQRALVDKRRFPRAYNLRHPRPQTLY